MSITTTLAADRTQQRSSTDYVPADFSDLFENYYPYVTHLVQKFGIEAQNSEDVAMTILTKFYEKDVLADYSPTFTSHHGGVERPAVFSTFLSGFVFSYVRHYRNRQTLGIRREGKSIYAPVGTGEAGGVRGFVEWIDVYGPAVDTDYDEVFAADLVRQITAHLAALPPSARARVNLVSMFTRIIEQVEQAGKYDVPALSSEFGVSQNSIRNWIHRLRDEITEVLASV